MKIKRVSSHILGYDLPEPLGYSQQYYTKRTAHLVEVETDEGITGWGECFGAGNIALANKGIVEMTCCDWRLSSVEMVSAYCVDMRYP